MQFSWHYLRARPFFVATFSYSRGNIFKCQLEIGNGTWSVNSKKSIIYLESITYNCFRHSTNILHYVSLGIDWIYIDPRSIWICNDCHLKNWNTEESIYSTRTIINRGYYFFLVILWCRLLFIWCLAVFLWKCAVTKQVRLIMVRVQ